MPDPHSPKPDAQPPREDKIEEQETDASRLFRELLTPTSPAVRAIQHVFSPPPKWDESLAPPVDGRAKALLRGYLRDMVNDEEAEMVEKLVARFQSWQAAYDEVWAEFSHEALAPPIDEKAKALLRAYVRDELTAVCCDVLYDLTTRFQSWEEAYFEAENVFKKEAGEAPVASHSLILKNEKKDIPPSPWQEDQSVAPPMDDRTKLLLRAYVRGELAGGEVRQVRSLCLRFQSWENALLDACFNTLSEKA
jgi:hypothetical protein